MLIKVYIHPSKLSFLTKNSVIATQMPNSQYDVELFIDLRKYKVTHMANGIYIQKKTILERILKKGK